uniref:Uncharacterized protein n=1 Tax=Solanum lycopersicum TaxID=4081 RepID=A0A3Q7IPH0_SOLLC
MSSSRMYIVVQDSLGGNIIKFIRCLQLQIFLAFIFGVLMNLRQGTGVFLEFTETSKLICY